MRLPKFDYYGPQSLKEVCDFLFHHKRKALISAGGTDILVKLKEGNITPPRFLVGLRNIPELDYIKYSEDRGLRIGALCTHNVLLASPIIREKYPVLFQGASQVGTVEVRNMGTIGGNICNASPSADTVPPLLVLGAKVKLVSTEGERLEALDNFFIGPGEVILKEGEVLSEIQILPPLPNSSGVYFKLPARSAIDLACVGVAVVLVSDEKKEICQDIKIALGAVAPTPIRARKAEAIIKGQRIEDELIKRASLASQEEATPITDLRGTAEYRKEMVKRLTEKAIKAAWGNLA